MTGFARDVLFAFFFGTGIAADAYAAALRIPNIVRNLLGEGTLSASFIPVYSGLLGQRAAPDARRLAATILGTLFALAVALSGLGVLLAPWLTRLIVPGWSADSIELTIGLVRILFPMAGFMILAAWCLGILNSHRRFFLPFGAPVLWNAAQIAGLLIAWRAGWEPLIYVLAWSTLIGGALQFLVQFPTAVRLTRPLRPNLRVTDGPARRVLVNLGPVIVGAGVLQISSFFDVFLASFIAHGAVSGLYYAQRLYYLPLSLFGISVAAATLPELSRDAAAASLGELRDRIRSGFRAILFTVIPSAIALAVYGDWIVALLFERGDFAATSRVVVHATLAAYCIALPAAACVKLFASGFHAMLDTRTPVRYAVAAVVIGAGTGAILMWPLYAPGLALGSAIGAWVNLTALWSSLGRRVGALFGRDDLGYVLKVMGAGLAAAAAGWTVELVVAPPVETVPPLIVRVWVTVGTLGTFGVVYLAATRLLNVYPTGGPRLRAGRPA